MVDGKDEGFYQVDKDLREIVSYVMPKDDTNCTVEILPFDNSVHEAPVRHLRPEVEVTLKVIHRCGFAQPLDQEEEKCLKDLESRLQALGISRG